MGPEERAAMAARTLRTNATHKEALRTNAANGEQRAVAILVFDGGTLRTTVMRGPETFAPFQAPPALVSSPT